MGYTAESQCKLRAVDSKHLPVESVQNCTHGQKVQGTTKILADYHSEKNNPVNNVHYFCLACTLQAAWHFDHNNCH